MWAGLLRRDSLIATISRFSIVGVGATLTYFVVANALILLARMEPVAASITAYLAGMLVSYLGQRRFTFGVRASWRQSVRFAILSALGLAISWGSVAGAVALGWPPLWGTVVTSLLVPVLNFLVMKSWVFVEDRIPDTLEA